MSNNNLVQIASEIKNKNEYVYSRLFNEKYIKSVVSYVIVKDENNNYELLLRHLKKGKREKDKYQKKGQKIKKFNYESFGGYNFEHSLLFIINALRLELYDEGNIVITNENLIKASNLFIFKKVIIQIFLLKKEDVGIKYPYSWETSNYRPNNKNININPKNLISNSNVYNKGNIVIYVKLILNNHKKRTYKLMNDHNTPFEFHKLRIAFRKSFSMLNNQKYIYNLLNNKSNSNKIIFLTKLKDYNTFEEKDYFKFLQKNLDIMNKLREYSLLPWKPSFFFGSHPLNKREFKLESKSYKLGPEVSTKKVKIKGKIDIKAYWKKISKNVKQVKGNTIINIIIFGCIGSGKSTILSKLHEYIPEYKKNNFIHIDPDEAREFHEDYQKSINGIVYAESINKNKEITDEGYFDHDDGKYISIKNATERSRNIVRSSIKNKIIPKYVVDKYNAIYNSTCLDLSYCKNVFKPLSKNEKRYYIGIWKPLDKIQMSVKKRALYTGRFVEPNYITKVYKQLYGNNIKSVPKNIISYDYFKKEDKSAFILMFDNSINKIKLIQKSNIKDKNIETISKIISGKKRIIHIGPKGGKYYENKNKKIYIK